jgi:hypothetical protein
MDIIIAFFSAPSTWDIGHINSWIVAACAYALVALFIARCVGTNGKRASEDINAHSPAHYYQAQVGTKRTFTDVDMDDPEWARILEEEL